MAEEATGVYEILRALMRGNKRFSELEDDGIPTKTLSERLKQLEDAGYVSRKILDTRPPRPEYEIVDKGKAAFREMALSRYGYHAEDAFLVAPTEAARIAETCLREYAYPTKEFTPKEERRRPETLIEQVRIGPTSLREKSQVTLQVMAELEDETGAVEDATLYDALARKGAINEIEAKILVNQLIKEGVMYRPKPGLVKRTWTPAAVLASVDGVIFERPWDETADEQVGAGIWDMLFKRLGIYEEHERLKNKYKAGEFKHYFEWTDAACAVLKEKGLDRETFYSTINSLRFTKGVRELFATLKAHNIKTGLITGSFYELAGRAKKELGVDEIHAHCRLIFDSDGRLTDWKIDRTDYTDKPTIVKLFCQTMNIPLERVLYIGDDVNDIPVSKEVGLFAAFNTTKTIVRESAKVTIDSKDLREVLSYVSIATPSQERRREMEPLPIQVPAPYAVRSRAIPTPKRRSVRGRKRKR